MSYCTSLLRLDATHNELRSLPSSLGKLTSLTSLLLAENPIQSLPPDLKRPTSITELQVKITQLSSVRNSGADVEDSGPKLPPQEIILRGEDAILSYAGKLRDGALCITAILAADMLY